MNRIKELRKEKKRSQQQMADFLKTTQTTFSNYETGVYEAPYEVLIGLSKYFNVTIDYLLGLSDTRGEVKTEKEPVVFGRNGISEENKQFIGRLSNEQLDAIRIFSESQNKK